MQCRLPATVRCVSHPSAHVRALSRSVLGAMLHAGSSINSDRKLTLPAMNGSAPPYECTNVSNTDWQADIEKCLTWEAHSRLATGLPIQFVDNAAKELGCTISIEAS